MTSAVSGCAVHGGRSVLPDHSLLLRERLCRRDCVGHYLPAGALRGGRRQILITVRSWWSSGMEMTLVGAVEGVVTYVIGIGLGRLGT